jgi:predicted dehydrogenase
MVSIGIIGCGNISRTHAWSISRNPKARLAGVCDIISDRAQALSSEYSCRPFSDYRELLDDKTIDAVSIALPHYLHAAVFEDVVKSGKHCLCEKPLATTFQDLQRMVAISATAHSLNGALFQHRFAAKNRAIDRFIKSGGLGSLRGADLVFECLRTEEYYRSEAWRGTWRKEGGSLLINQAIHFIDLTTRFFGLPSIVQGQIERRHITGIETEDTAEARLDYPGGAEINIHAFNRPGKPWSHTICFAGSRGSLRIMDGAIHADSAAVQKEMDSFIEEEEKIVFLPDTAPGKACYGNAHALAFADFIDAILEGRPPAISIAEGAIPNQIVLAIYISAASRRAINLSDILVADDMSCNRLSDGSKCRPVDQRLP